MNFDLHGDNGKQETSYLKGRAAPAASGVLEAAFDGHHGWFWRNRGNGREALVAGLEPRDRVVRGTSEPSANSRL